MTHIEQQAIRPVEVVSYEPLPVRELSTVEWVVMNIKNVLVIITCLAVLYALWVSYQAIQSLGDAMQQMQDGFAGLGG